MAAGDEVASDGLAIGRLAQVLDQRRPRCRGVFAPLAGVVGGIPPGGHAARGQLAQVIGETDEVAPRSIAALAFVVGPALGRVFLAPLGVRVEPDVERDQRLWVAQERLLQLVLSHAEVVFVFAQPHAGVALDVAQPHGNRGEVEAGLAEALVVTLYMVGLRLVKDGRRGLAVDQQPAAAIPNHYLTGCLWTRLQDRRQFFHGGRVLEFRLDWTDLGVYRDQLEIIEQDGAGVAVKDDVDVDLTRLIGLVMDDALLPLVRRRVDEQALAHPAGAAVDRVVAEHCVFGGADPQQQQVSE